MRAGVRFFSTVRRPAAMTLGLPRALLLAAAALATTASGCGGSIASEPPGNEDAGGRPPPHSGRDAAAARDGALGDPGGGTVSCTGGACPSPGDVSGFVPAWKAPTGAHLGQCTAALIDEYYQDCLAVGGVQTCTAFGPGADGPHQACGGCITSNFADSTWGPLVRSPNVVETNGAGCIALLDPTALDCAKSVQALAECEHAACDPVCHAAGSVAFDDWVQCSAAANACGCKSRLAASDCVTQIVSDGGPAAACLVGQTFQDFFRVTAGLFCGS